MYAELHPFHHWGIYAFTFVENAISCEEAITDICVTVLPPHHFLCNVKFRQKRRDRVFSAVSLPRWPQGPQMSWPSVRNQQLFLGLLHGRQVPKTSASLFWFPMPRAGIGMANGVVWTWSGASIWDAGNTERTSACYNCILSCPSFFLLLGNRLWLPGQVKWATPWKSVTLHSIHIIYIPRSVSRDASTWERSSLT